MKSLKPSTMYIALLIFLSGQQSLQAAADLSVVEALNNAMIKVTENAEKIQNLNKQEDSLAGFFQDLQNASTEDTVKIAAANIDYPAPLKSAFDRSLDLAFASINDVFNAAVAVQDNAECKDRMLAVKLKTEKMEPAIRKSQELNVTEARSKVEAYGAVMLSLPLGLAGSELGMTYMMACTF